MKNVAIIVGAVMAEWGLGLCAIGGFFGMLLYHLVK